MTATCRECGKPYAKNDMLYSIASEFDDDGELVSFCHWDCRIDVSKAVAKLRDSITKVENALKDPPR